MEHSTATKYKPYTQFLNMERVRDAYIAGTLQIPLEAASLRALKIPSSGIFSTKRALEDFGLFKNGQPTELFERLTRAYQLNINEYCNILEALLKDYYAEVFAYIEYAQINLTTATAAQLEEAFSAYVPKNQNARMIYLFLALAREAQIIPDIRKVPHREDGKFASRGQQNDGLETSSEKEVELMNNQNGRAGKSQELSFIKTQRDYLQSLLEQLPLDVEQSKQKRAAWVNILRGNLDVLIQLLEEKETQE